MTYKFAEILLISKHEKAMAIREPVESFLQATLTETDHFDTDLLGTFSGEIERKLSPFETAKIKARSGLLDTDHKYSIATEGSFYPHPIIPFLTAHNEIMVFYDLDSDRYIHESYTTTNTNSYSITLSLGDDYISFCNRVKFPSHGIIIKASNNDKSKNIKGIKSHKMLEGAIAEAFEFSENQPITLETDMRAMMNPTRMAAINVLAIELCRKITTYCPSCHLNGFGNKRSNKGLPCADCGAPTDGTLSNDTLCDACGHKESDFIDKLAEPRFCLYCNP